MISLEAGQTLQGVAGTTNVITYTLLGADERVGPVNTYKTLGQGQLTNSTAVLYTVPASTAALIATIALVNTTAIAVPVQMFVGGTGSTHLIMPLTVPASGSAYYTRDGWQIYDANGVKQTVGLQGPQGFQGAVGSQGTQGVQGLTGSQGSQGFQGQVGSQGPQGVQGSVGSQGPQGFQGSAGPQGTQGVQGSVGSQGPQGFQGNPGPQGNQGTQGTTGAPTSLAAVGGTPNANGGTIAGSVLTLAPSSVLFPGEMSAGDFAAARRVYDAYRDFGIVEDLRGAEEITATGTQVVMTSGSNVVNIPNSGATVPFTSTSVDSGKRIIVQGAGASGASLIGFIGVVNTSTQCTVLATVGGSALNASTTVTATTSSTVNVQWHTVNDTAWALLASTLNAAVYPQAKVVFGNHAFPDWTGSIAMSVPITLNKAPWFEGLGGGHTTDVGDYRKIGGNRVAWTGATQDAGTPFTAMVTVAASGTQALKRPQFTNFWLDGRNGDQNQAIYGIKLSSAHGAVIDDGLFFMDFVGAGLWCDISTTPTEAADTTRFAFGKMCFRSLDDSSMSPPTLTPTTTSTALTLTGSGQTLTLVSVTGFAAGGGYAWCQTTQGRPFLIHYSAVSGSTITGCIVSTEDVVHQPTTYANAFVVPATPSKGSAMKLSGGTAHNTSIGVVKQIQMSYGSTFGPAAIDCGNSDTITFEQITGNGGSDVIEANGNRKRRPGFRAAGSTVSNTLACRNIVMRDIDPGGAPGGPLGGISSMALLNTGALMPFPAGPTYVELQQMGNGAPLPTVEQGSSLIWTGNGLWVPGPVSPVLTVATALTASTLDTLPALTTIVPPQGWQVGTKLRWEIPVHKTAVGTSITINIRQNATGVAGSGGTVIATVTYTGTILADGGIFTLDLICTTLGSGTSGAAIANFELRHDLTATGLCTGVTTPAASATAISGTVRTLATMAGFDTTAPGGGPTFLFAEINPVTALTVLTVDAGAQVLCMKGANP